MTAAEQWRPVIGYESLYEVSDHGRVRSVDRLRTQTIARGADRSVQVTRRLRGRVLTPTKIKAGGYMRVSLSDGPRKATPRKIHQLVADAFIGPCPEGLMPLHGDGNPENNRLGNIRYGTSAENVADAKAHGTFAIGERRPQAKITDADAGVIKALIGTLSLSALGRVFGLSPSGVAQIRDEVTWKHVAATDAADARRELDRRKAAA